MRGTYPLDLEPGDKVRRKDINGRKTYTVKSQDKYGWVYTKEGDTFLREQLGITRTH